MLISINTKELEKTFETTLERSGFKEKLETMHEELLKDIFPRTVCIGLKMYSMNKITFLNILLNYQLDIASTWSFESVLKSISVPDDFHETENFYKTVDFKFMDDEIIRLVFPAEHTTRTITLVGNKKFDIKGVLVCDHGNYRGRITFSEQYFGSRFSLVEYLGIKYKIRSIRTPIMKSFINCIEKEKVTIKDYIDKRLLKIEKKMKPTDFKQLLKVDYYIKLYFLLFLYKASVNYYTNRRVYVNTYYRYDYSKNCQGLGIKTVAQNNYEALTARETLKFLEDLEK